LRVDRAARILAATPAGRRRTEFEQSKVRRTD
jgi:hypothetical protein